MPSSPAAWLEGLNILGIATYCMCAGFSGYSVFYTAYGAKLNASCCEGVGLD